jgi:hypothetical protein
MADDREEWHLAGRSHDLARLRVAMSREGQPASQPASQPHCLLVLLPTSRETAVQSRPCRSSAALSLISSALLHESRICLPTGSCMRPAATSIMTLSRHCCLVLLPTSRETETQSRPCLSTAALSWISSAWLHDSCSCLPPGSSMRPAATSVSTFLKHCFLVLLLTSRETAAAAADRSDSDSDSDSAPLPASCASEAERR